ncbi:hypothetical protein POVWA2_014540 [Plasmodium ovale wallikeri]|nr:hypothetical protein POVWA2_014540 [Plasmodium ovale wallikeri]
MGLETNQKYILKMAKKLHKKEPCNCPQSVVKKKKKKVKITLPNAFAYKICNIPLYTHMCVTGGMCKSVKDHSTTGSHVLFSALACEYVHKKAKRKITVDA